VEENPVPPKFYPHPHRVFPVLETASFAVTRSKDGTLSSSEALDPNLPHMRSGRNEIKTTAHLEAPKMNSDQLEGKWKQVKGEVREKWGKLTDDDIHVVAGRREQLIGKVQERYGLAKEEATKQVDAFVKNIEDAQESVGNRTKVRSVGQ
jgi:uncharacterized protein YjbJ (UPF0337 family)